MHRVPAHDLERDRYYRQIPSPTPSKVVQADRRSVGNSTVSPPTFYTIGFESLPYRSSRTFDNTDAIEPFPRAPSLSPGPRVPSIPGYLATVAQLDATVTCLWILTPLTATVSAVIILVAITTNQWLHTEEKMNNPAYNGTGDKDYLSKLTVSGLWKICFTNPGEKSFECSKIDYFPKEEYSPDPNDSTMAIPYAVIKSSFFLLLATAILFAGYVCCTIGHCAKHRRIFTFSSGVLFIISGLLMLVGLVMYISVFKAEVGYKLRQPSFSQPPSFTYRYGYSFILYVSGFITIEMAGTSAVFLFINWYQKDWIVTLTEKCEKYTPGSESNISYTNLDQASVYPCKKHPQAYTVQRTQPIGAACEPSTSGYMSPSRQRRYYFDKESSPSCSLHRNRNVYVSTSLRDVSNSTYEFPPPPPALASTSYADYNNGYPEKNFSTYRNGYSAGSTRSLHSSGANTLPRDATTNTVSTTVDINPCDDFGFSEAVGPVFVDFSPSVARDGEFVTFDLGRNLEMRPNPVQGAAKKDFGSDKLRRTTPV